MSPKIAKLPEIRINVGDRMRSIQATLRSGDGLPVNLTGNTLHFLMIRAANSVVKVNYAAAIIVTAASGIVRYDWASGDVDTAGEFYLWFRRTSGGLVEHFPAGGRVQPIVFLPAG